MKEMNRAMLPEDLEKCLRQMVAETPHPREKAVDVMLGLQHHFGWLSDEAVRIAADILGMTPLEIEELATFYDFIYREPVGKYVIHVCDGVVCWMHHEDRIFNHLCERLGVKLGETTCDGLFTVLPTACLGDCDHAPSMLINGRFYGSLNPEKIDRILDELRQDHQKAVLAR